MSLRLTTRFGFTLLTSTQCSRAIPYILHSKIQSYHLLFKESSSRCLSTTDRFQQLAMAPKADGSKSLKVLQEEQCKSVSSFSVMFGSTSEGKDCALTIHRSFVDTPSCCSRQVQFNSIQFKFNLFFLRIEQQIYTKR